MGKKSSVNIIVKLIGMVVGSALLGLFLMWLVYLLPVEKMAENVADSAELLYAQNDSKELIAGDYWKAYDRGTNIIILHEIIYPNNGQALTDALLVPTADYTARWDEDWADVLLEYAANREYDEDDDYLPYARYWHGYLVLLKPLFLFLDLGATYMLNLLLFGISTIVIAFLMKKHLGSYWKAYVLLIMVMYPINIIQSYQLSSVFYAMQLTMFLLLLKDTWKEEDVLSIFVLDGIVLAFLDFLTYPLVAFAVPALTAYLLSKKSCLKENLCAMIGRGFAFGLGYAGMWAMKWIFASIFTTQNVILDAIDSILHRTGVVENTYDENFMSISTADALMRNLKSFFNEYNLIILAIVCIISFFYIVAKKVKGSVDKQMLLVCSVIGISPFLWIMLLTNHSSLHPHLEWRTFAILIYAVAILGISIWGTDVRGKENG